MKDVMLTTLDNPFNPLTQFTDWNSYDESKGYFTLNYLSRIAVVGDNLSEADEHQAVEDAIDEIVDLNLLGNYVKVTSPDWVSPAAND